MIANRVVGWDDYLAMARRHSRMILVIALASLVAGFLISYLFPRKYTSTASIQAERPAPLPSGIVKPYGPTFLQVNFREIGERRNHMVTLEQQVLSRSHLQEVVNRLGLAQKGRSVDAIIDDIQANFSITEADLSASIGSPAAFAPTVSSSTSTNGPPTVVPYTYSVPGFSISFAAGNPRDAQQICAELTSDLLTEDIKGREQEAADTTDFFSRQVEEAKSNLDEEDKKLALFKGQHLGQLPTDVSSDLQILALLNSQLEAATQALNRAQQDKAYSESLLAQQVAAWKSQSSVTAETIERQLATLQTQLVALQTRYTDDHPEVVKTKNDIAGLEAKQKKMSASSGQDAVKDQTVAKIEPPEILQLREQIRQSEGLIVQNSLQQKRLQEMIDSYQSRLTLSPKVEEEYNRLTRDSQAAHQVYDGLLTNKSESAIHTDMERSQQGEKMRLLNSASLPDSPSFPQRWKFAAGGLGLGLTLGICLALSLELGDKAIRNEADVLAGVELPMLTAIPWVGAVAIEEGWRGRFKALLGH